VVTIPFANTHREEVHVFVELVEECNGLDDHIVNTVDVELEFGARVGVTKAELSFLDVVCLKALQEFCGM
jgi:hypothetical protein